MTSILNISAYKFVALTDTFHWQTCLREQAQTFGLKGTVLLAEEGINLFVAGPAPGLRAFLAWLVLHDEFSDLQTKESWSDTVPFGKMMVKVKPEIIRMNHPTVRAQMQRAPAVDAKTLARWLVAGHDDAGREVVMLDTRNAFEVDRGRFRGAHDWRIGKFSEFPQALKTHRAELEGKTVVSYCTGGIRCEKAALLMADAGMPNVFQLDGGILKYFEEMKGGRAAEHFEGDCFVFDDRGTLNDTLKPVRAM